MTVDLVLEDAPHHSIITVVVAAAVAAAVLFMHDYFLQVQDCGAGVWQCAVSQLDAASIAMAVMFGVMYVSSMRFGKLVFQVIQAHAPEQLPADDLSMARVWLGVLVHSILTPAAILLNVLRRDVRWSGIQYKIHAGRVVQVVHHSLMERSPHS